MTTTAPGNDVLHRSSPSAGVLELRMNRPAKRNALNGALVKGIVDGIREAEADKDVAAVVLTAEGGAFCAGADLDELKTAGGTEALRRSDLGAALYSAVRRSEVPVIASVDGPAVAGGCGLALSCDLVFCSPRASFGFPEVRRGLIPAYVMVVAQHGIARRPALELMIGGETVTAADALRMGLVNRVCESDVDDRAREYAERLAGFPDGAVRRVKRTYTRLEQLPTEAAADYARDLSLALRSGS